MSWARYDDELSINRKWVALRAQGVKGAAALGLHLLANTWSRHNGTAGHVPSHVPEMLVGRDGPKLAAMLHDVGMFDLTDTDDGGGWTIHDFDEFHDPNDPDPNRSAADRKKELSEKRAASGRAGGLAKASKTPSKKVAVLQQEGWQNPSPVPVPEPVPKDSLPPKSLDSPEGGDNSASRLTDIAQAYASHAYKTAVASGVQVKFQDRYEAKAHRTALSHDDIGRLAEMFPTAPATVIAACLNGDKHGLQYYPRADEIEAAQDGPENADVIPFTRRPA